MSSDVIFQMELDHIETIQQDNGPHCTANTEVQPLFRNHEIVVSIEEKILVLPPIAKECCIYRVPKRLFNVKPSAYTPQVISIGPFHHGKENLVKMEQEKLRFLDCYLRRTKICVKKAFDIARTWEVQARRCYAEPINMNSKKFVEMMLVDGCFIVEYLITFYSDPPKNETRDRLDTHLYCAIHKEIYCDLTMLENQIPFFVLRSLFDLLPQDESTPLSLIDLAHNFSRYGLIQNEETLRSFINLALNILCHDIFAHVKHLVDLLSFNFVPSSIRENSESKKLKSMLSPVVTKLCAACVACVKIKKPTEDNDEQAVTELNAACVACVKIKKSTEDNGESKKPKSIFPQAITELYATCVACVKIKKPTEDNSESNMNPLSNTNPPTVTELHEAGVKIKKAAKENFLMDICFKDGVLEIPHFVIDDCYETTVRNIMAYEHYGVWSDRKYVIQYISFLDELISTREDVRILVKEGIITNSIGGSNKEVAKLFNDLCKEVILPASPWHFDHISQDLRKHCKKVWNHWKASLRRNYCSTPWATISIFAAIFLLLLTFLQTLFSAPSF